MYTVNAFIRKNTLNIVDKLNSIGMTQKYVYTEGNSTIAVDGKYWHCNSYMLKCIDYFAVDCGTNEEMFLSIAAMRDDSDYMQWFIDRSTNTWKKCTEFDSGIRGKNGEHLLDMGNGNVGEKASLQEIIEHFKKDTAKVRFGGNRNDYHKKR